MKDLLKYIDENTIGNNEEIKSSILNMVCDENAPVNLNKESILNALRFQGEFLILKLHYKDFPKELEEEKIKYKISQALSIAVTYEDDGQSYENIEKFIKYIYEKSDTRQNSIFGVKKVEKLSEFPITILFSGILPINQLKMTLGKKIHELIRSDFNYFRERFKKYRLFVSDEIGIPILPIFPELDESLGDFRTIQ